MDPALENCISETIKEFEEISIEDVQLRHRKERKELQSKIQALKKIAPKNDKKKRKEALDQIAKLEADLEKKQLCEIEKFKIHDTKSNILSNEVTTGFPTADSENHSVESQQQRVTKAQKRRDRKDRAAKQKDEEIKAYLAEEANTPKAIEVEKLDSKLKQRQLALYNIPSDGDCLYNAVQHQLLQRGLSHLSIKELRNLTSDYIKLNKSSLIPYMTNPESGNLLTDAEFEKYCDDIRCNSSWGGQIELKALSFILKVPIEVLQGDGSPTLQGEEFGRSPLVITYHRHLYSLGEHYNSTVPQPDADFEEQKR